MWARWGGTVYDVPFGEAEQNGFEPAEGRPDADRRWHFKVGAQWYRATEIPNTYIKSGPPA